VFLTQSQLALVLRRYKTLMHQTVRILQSLELELQLSLHLVVAAVEVQQHQALALAVDLDLVVSTLAEQLLVALALQAKVMPVAQA
jgi:hypothetical protein